MSPSSSPASPTGSSRMTPGRISPNPDFGFYTYPKARPTFRSSRNSHRRNYHSHHSSPSPSILSVNSAFWILFSLNALSFTTYQYALLTKNQKLLTTHLSNTLLSLSSLSSGKYWTLLTSAFTHHDILHFAFNMFTLKTFCTIISFVPGIGGAHVLALALASSLAGSGGWLWQQSSRLTALTSQHRGWGRGSNVAAEQVRHASAIGASGAVMGVAAVATCLLPSIPIQLMFIPIGIPLWVVTVGYAVVDGWYLDSSSSRIAHSGHLGGLGAGLAYYGLVLARKAPVGVWRSFRGVFGRR